MTRRTRLGLLLPLLVFAALPAAAQVDTKNFDLLREITTEHLKALMLIFLAIGLVAVAYSHKAGLMIFFSVFIIFIILLTPQFLQNLLSMMVNKTFTDSTGASTITVIAKYIIYGSLALVMVAGLIHIADIAAFQGRGLVDFGWAIVALILFALIFRYVSIDNGAVKSTGGILNYMDFNEMGK